MDLHAVPKRAPVRERPHAESDPYTCPMCHTPMIWEVDVARQQERWVCRRCPYMRMQRGHSLRHARLSNPQGAAPHAFGNGHSAAPAPSLALTQ